MVDTPVAVERLTIEEFVRLYNQEGPFEIVEGARVAVSPTVARHNVIAKRLFAALLRHEQDTEVGETFMEAPFVLTYSPDWVKGSRVPDVMFFQKDRLETYRAEQDDWESKPFVLVPDLAVEIVSTNDSYSDVQQKVSRYLEDGVQAVWVIDPQARAVTVYVRGSNQQTILRDDATLTGGEVIPGFEIPLAELFGEQT